MSQLNLPSLKDCHDVDAIPGDVLASARYAEVDWLGIVGGQAVICFIVVVADVVSVVGSVYSSGGGGNIIVIVVVRALNSLVETLVDHVVVAVFGDLIVALVGIIIHVVDILAITGCSSSNLLSRRLRCRRHLHNIGGVLVGRIPLLGGLEDRGEGR